MDKKKESIIKKVVGCLVIVFFVSLLLGLVCSNSNYIFTKEKYYSQTELNKKIEQSYNNGYNAGIDSYGDMQKLLGEYSALIVEQEQSIEQSKRQVETLTSQVDNLTKENAQLSSSIETITNERDGLLIEKENLENIISANEKSIEENNSKIATLQEKIKVLENNGEHKTQEIDTLQSQINALTTQNNNLQANNVTNLENLTIANNRIASLENDISTLTIQMQENATKVVELQEEKTALQNSIAYYEQFIALLETEHQAVAIFEVENTLYNAQIVVKGNNVSVESPADTETMAFVGWQVNNELVDLTTYSITTNTKFVAKFDYSYNVNFVVDNDIYSTVKVVKNGYASVENSPTKTGYEFDGWTINGVDTVDLSTCAITEDTTFVARFTKLHLVTFINGDNVVSSQNVYNGCLASYPPETPIKSGYQFVGWSIDGSSVIEELSPVYGDTTFIALFTKSYGLFDADTGDMTMSWDTLKSENYITVNNGVLKGGNNVKQISGVLIISDEVSSIYMLAFEKCTNIVSVEFPDTLTEIGNRAFSGCTKLTHVVIPSSVTTLKQAVFENCTGLKSLYIPSSVNLIDCSTTGGDTYYPNALCYGCSSELLIYCEALEKPRYWSSYWCRLNNNTDHSVKWNYTYEQYCAEVSV